MKNFDICVENHANLLIDTTGSGEYAEDRAAIGSGLRRPLVGRSSCLAEDRAAIGSGLRRTVSHDRQADWLKTAPLLEAD